MILQTDLQTSCDSRIYLPSSKQAVKLDPQKRRISNGSTLKTIALKINWIAVLRKTKSGREAASTATRP